MPPPLCPGLLARAHTTATPQFRPLPAGINNDAAMPYVQHVMALVLNERLGIPAAVNWRGLGGLKLTAAPGTGTPKPYCGICSDDVHQIITHLRRRWAPLRPLVSTRREPQAVPMPDARTASTGWRIPRELGAVQLFTGWADQKAGWLVFAAPGPAPFGWASGGRE